MSPSDSLIAQGTSPQSFAADGVSHNFATVSIQPNAVGRSGVIEVNCLWNSFSGFAGVLPSFRILEYGLGGGFNFLAPSDLFALGQAALFKVRIQFDPNGGLPTDTNTSVIRHAIAAGGGSELFQPILTAGLDNSKRINMSFDAVLPVGGTFIQLASYEVRLYPSN